MQPESTGDLKAFALVNARVALNESRAPNLGAGRPTAILIEDGRIAHVGDDDTVRELLHRGQAIDVHGAVIAPGLVDAHIHAFDCGVASLHVSCLPPEVDSLAALKRRLTDRAASRPPGSMGGGNRIRRHAASRASPPLVPGSRLGGSPSPSRRRPCVRPYQRGEHDRPYIRWHRQGNPRSTGRDNCPRCDRRPHWAPFGNGPGPGLASDTTAQRPRYQERSHPGRQPDPQLRNHHDLRGSARNISSPRAQHLVGGALRAMGRTTCTVSCASGDSRARPCRRASRRGHQAVRRRRDHRRNCGSLAGI
jgi:Amidohydrolase family